MSYDDERLAKYREQLEAVDEAILKVLSGQSYSLGSRTVTRADLKQLRLFRKELESDIAALETNGTTRRRFKRVVPMG